jgi:hypothetical protein
MKNSMRFLGLFLAALVLLPGCMHVPTYQRKSLNSVSDHCTYRGAEKNVIVRAKLLSRANKKVLFGIRSTLIHDNDLQVIYISIHNLSSVHYLLSPTDIDLAMMPYHDVAQLMKTSSVKGLAGGLVCSGISAATPAGYMTFGLLFQLPILANGVLAIGVVTAGVALTFFGTSIKSIVMNSRIKKDLAEKVLHKPVIINSGEQYEGLVFIKSSDYTPQFAVTMHEKNDVNNTITFDVDLRQNEKQE